MLGFVRQRVYLQLFIAFAFGTAIGAHWPLPTELLLSSPAWIGAILAIPITLWAIWRSHTRPVGLAALYGLTALIGLLSASLFVRGALATPLRQLTGKDIFMRGVVSSIPKYQKGHLRFMLDVREVLADQGYRPAAGRVYVYVKCDPGSRLYFRDAVRVHTKLQEIESPRNRGQFNYRRYLLQRGTVLTAYVPTINNVRRLREDPPQPWAALSVARERLLRAVTAGLPPHLGQLAASVIYGDKITELPEELEERFRNAGLTHILVASGTQVSLLIAVLTLLLWRIGDSATWRGRALIAAQFGLTLAAVLAYGAITGFETSIVRALVMGGVVLLGQAASREADGLTALAQAGLIMLVLSPLELLSPGFQLSFGATFGLIYAAGIGFPLTARLTGWRQAFARMFVTTAGAQLFVAPILAAQFNQLSLWGLLSNFFAIPLSFALLVIGGIASLGLVYVPLLGTLLRWAVLALSWALDGVARVFSALPGSSVAVPTPPWWWLALCYALVFAAGEWLKAERLSKAPPAARLRMILQAGTAACAMLLLAGILWWLLVPRPELAVLALKNGEAYIWRSGAGRNVLLLHKAGLARNHNLDTVTSALRSRGINKLHGIVWADGNVDPSPLPDYPAPILDWSGEWIPGLDLRLSSSFGGNSFGCRYGSVRISVGHDLEIENRLVIAWQNNDKAEPSIEYEEPSDTEMDLRPDGMSVQVLRVQPSDEL